MTTMVTARIPTTIKRQADTILKQLGASHTDLINAAYTYLVTHGCLPSTKPTITNTAMPSPARLFVLDDVLLDYVLCAKPHFSDFNKLLIMASFGDVELCASSSVLHSVLNMCGQNNHAPAACHMLRDLIRPIQALSLREFVPQQVAGIQALVTLEPQQFKHGSPKAYTPAQLVEYARQVRGLEYDEVALPQGSD